MTRVDTTTLETYLGHYVDYLDPKPEDIELADIARGLAHTCRFAGHTTRFYSVAEHAVLVAEIIERRFGLSGSRILCLAALHHDSHEAYLGDWPTPLKLAVGATELSGLQDKFDIAIGAAFGIDPELFTHEAIKAADMQALYGEAATLKPSRGIGYHWGNEQVYPPIPGAGMPPEYAERIFVQAHSRYS